MKEASAATQPEIKYLSDYQPPAYTIDRTELYFDIQPAFTLVSCHLTMRRQRLEDLQLDGQLLELIACSVDDKPLSQDHYAVTAEHLIIQAKHLADSFTLSTKVKIFPAENTSLEGLYHSRGMYCTQCEAEGFRKITYFIDRPDVMSEFLVTIQAPEGRFNRMLSNGNCIQDTVLDGVRTVCWHDPFKKPCYLFALVVGNLAVVEDQFVTQSGRDVKLQIFVEDKDVEKCAHAMLSLQQAMRWDETVYGREYDLDVYMIVAVDDFNMGAMENKGLNVFNTSCVLAHPDTTTDQGFQRVEAVVAHEYFHNWSGNRVTCRDWFQLSLKEGFTVYRDSEFSADMNSRAVKRIEDASFLRAHQFVEDAGPMAHPVQPKSFIEISNFYTLTIYEKGAEVVRMMANLLGPERFRQATDLYFSRHDGQAVTCEDFVLAMEQAADIDLTQFRLWYDQAGTPTLEVTDDYDAEAQQYHLFFKQQIPAIDPKQAPQAMHIPVRIALLGEACFYRLQWGEEQADSSDNTEFVFDITQSEQQLSFNNIPEKPVPSLLRGFSAPIHLNFAYDFADMLTLLARDDDGFTRFNASQCIFEQLINAQMHQQAYDAQLQQLAATFAALLRDVDDNDPALLTMLMSLPAQSYLLERFKPCDPLALHHACADIKRMLIQQLQQNMAELYLALEQRLQDMQAVYQPFGQAIGLRALKNFCLSSLAFIEHEDVHSMIERQYFTANNMTDRYAALNASLRLQKHSDLAKQLLVDFYQRFADESLVVNMWFQAQAVQESDNALIHMQQLLEHPAFDLQNPNKCRALIASFCQHNHAAFHAVDGSGYQFLAAQIIALDKLNPQIAARMMSPLSHWRKYTANHAEHMRAALQTIAEQPTLSKDVFEVVNKSLNNSTGA